MAVIAPRVAPVLLLLTLTLPGAAALGAQGVIRGAAYDSLTRAPLAGATVQVQGTSRAAIVDSAGNFHLDSVPAGRRVVLLSHAGLDSAGFFNIATAVLVDSGRVATALLSTPSLLTIWRRWCGGAFVPGADSGVLMGTVADVATGHRLAGAGVVASWIDLRKTGPAAVMSGTRTAAVQSDSIGNYALCGIATDVAVHVRAYGPGDSTGAIQVHPGSRAVTRRDLQVGRTSRGAALRGAVQGDDGRPVVGARVTVADKSTTTNERGAYRLTGLPVGTQWLVVRSVARHPSEQAVDLRDGDTLTLDVVLGARAVTLDTVRVRANRVTLLLQEIEDRRVAGSGFHRGAQELNSLPDVVAGFQGFPNVRTERTTRAWVVVLPPRNARERGCVATIYLDGLRSSYDEVLLYKPSDLRAVEVFPRAADAPLKYASRNGCGVVLVWTKYLQ